MFSVTSMAAVSEQIRASIDRVIGHKGTYIPEEGVYRITLPREEAAIVQDYQRLSPNLGLNSWAAFASGVHHEAVLTGRFLLLEDEISPVLDIVLDAGLDVTGLAASCSFDGPHLRARGLNMSAIRNHTVCEHPQSIFIRFWGEGTAIQLAKAVRYVLDVQVGTISRGSGQEI